MATAVSCNPPFPSVGSAFLALVQGAETKAHLSSDSTSLATFEHLRRCHTLRRSRWESSRAYSPDRTTHDNSKSCSLSKHLHFCWKKFALPLTIPACSGFSSEVKLLLSMASFCSVVTSFCTEHLGNQQNEGRLTEGHCKASSRLPVAGGVKNWSTHFLAFVQ